MMYRKATLFSSADIAARILSPAGLATHPREIKALGRRVENFSQPVWDANRLAIVTEGSYLKFRGGRLRRLLLDTGDKALVEASPFDAIWGIGIAEKDARAGKRARGLNLLGVALVEARRRIREEEEEEGREAMGVVAMDEKDRDGNVGGLDGEGAEEADDGDEAVKEDGIADGWVEVEGVRKS